MTLRLRRPLLLLRLAAVATSLCVILEAAPSNADVQIATRVAYAPRHLRIEHHRRVVIVPRAFPRVMVAPAPVLPPPIVVEPSPIVVAPAPGPSASEVEVLTLTNAYRARGAVCGDQSFGPAPPLAPNAALDTAARAHSADMGLRRYFDHGDPDGHSASARISAAGFRGGFTGENIYGGPPTARDVVDGWMRSPGHCANIMNPRYTSLGVGHAHVDGSPLGDYWTQDFGG
jgi:uncharacterized protein YkwD